MLREFERFDALIKRATVVDERSRIDRTAGHRGKCTRHRATARSNELNLIDHDSVGVDLGRAGKRALEHERAAWSDMCERAFQSGIGSRRFDHHVVAFIAELGRRLNSQGREQAQLGCMSADNGERTVRRR